MLWLTMMDAFEINEKSYTEGHMGILELTNSITKIKSSVNRLKSRMERAEGKKYIGRQSCRMESDQSHKKM